MDDLKTFDFLQGIEEKIKSFQKNINNITPSELSELLTITIKAKETYQKELVVKNINDYNIKESEERFRSIIENTDAGYFFIDKNGIIQDINLAWTKMYKYSSPDEIIGCHFTEVQKIDDKELAIEYVNGIMKGNKDLMKGEFSRKCKDGSIGYHSFSAKPVKKNGALIGIEGFIIDSTERKAIEDKLKESEALLNEVGKIAKIGGWEHDLIHRTAKWTKATYDIVEIDYNDPVPGPDEYVEFFQPEFRQYIRESMRDLIEKGIPLDFDAKMKTVNGKIIWTRALGMREMKDGKCVKVFGTFQDINKQKIVQQKLKENEALLNEVGDIAKIGGWEMDLLTRKSVWTKGTYDIVEIDYNEPVPGPDEHISYYLSEFQPMIEKSMTDLIEHGIPLEFEAQFKPPSGKIKWCRALGRRIMKDGKCVKLYGTLQDITKLKEFELTLKESEKRLSAFFNSPLFGTIYGDIHGGIHKANDKYLEIIGYSREEVESGIVKWDQITPEEFKELDYERIKEAQEFGACTPYEKQYIRKDGSLIWVLVGYILTGEKKEDSLAFILDIQKIKDYQKDLEKKNQFIQTVLDNLPIGVATNDFDSGNVTYVNKEFENAYGWPAEEFPNVEFFFQKVFPDEDERKKNQEQIMEDILSGDPNRMKWENLMITTKKGEKNYVNAVNIPLIDQNIMISTVWDVTELHKVNEKLQKYRDHLEELVKARTAELEEKNKELEHFNQLFVGREFRIKELKDKIKELQSKLESGQ